MFRIQNSSLEQPLFLTCVGTIAICAKGCHLGVSPSYYKNWGYQWHDHSFCHPISNPASYGVYIVDRRFKSPDESVQQLANFMVEFVTQTRQQRIIQRNRTERPSELLDWKQLGEYYTFARCLSLHKLHLDRYPLPIPIEPGQDVGYRYPWPPSEPPSPRSSSPTFSELDIDEDAADIENREYEAEKFKNSQ